MLDLITLKTNARLDFPELYIVSHFMGFMGIDDYVVAGGFLRDKLHGCPFRDIDVFIPGVGALEPTLTRYGDIDATFAELMIDGLAVNLIKLKPKLTAADVLQRFDLGLCQVGMTTTWDLVCTKAYKADAANKTLTQLVDPQTDGDNDHILRVQAKYPSHTLVPFAQKAAA